MMAGTGVSSGGAGMLRARRRDVSVKPNRKLDRKSSRGMIYENEELRLRTIHINAEVEQGQNDIKKLRRENEQLRREIWSLRDEYDKLEEILKSQKNREGSEEYEDRSEGDDKDDDEEADFDSDYSVDEDKDDEEEECNKKEENHVRDEEAEGDEHDQEERLENAENQKISSEKMNNSLHRLHVEFDDLSVVDEEEEVKRDKERKDAIYSESKETKKSENDANLVRMDPRNGYPCFPTQYGSTSGQTYYQDCLFPREAGFSEILPINPSSMLMTPCPTIYDGSIGSLPNFESSGIASMQPRYEENLRNDNMTYENPIGWQSNIFAPDGSFRIAESYHDNVTSAQTSGICSASMFTPSGQSDQSTATTTSTVRATGVPRGTPIDERILTARLTNPIGRNMTNVSTLYQRRNVLSRQPKNLYSETIDPSRIALGRIEAPSSAETLTRNGWDFGSSGNIAGNRESLRDLNDHKNEKEARIVRGEDEETEEKLENQHRHDDSPSIVSNGASNDRPKHFFAPLAPKIQHGRQDSGDKKVTRVTTNPGESPSLTYNENFGTGLSSSSDRTNSTVISTQRFQRTRSTSGTGHLSDGGDKGSADICVNGAVSAYGNDERDWLTDEERIYKSSENLLIGDSDISRGNSSSRHGSSNPLVKSISCQDLTSEQLQHSLFEISRTFNGENKAQKFTKSDNTLDNPVNGSPKPFRSQLNVTLKLPGRCNSPDTPEIPKLPSIDYRLLSNRLLKKFDENSMNYGNYDPITRPLSIQVNDNVQGKSMTQPAIDYLNGMLTHSLARRLNPEENEGKVKMKSFVNEMESDRRRLMLLSSTSQSIDSRMITSPKLRQEFQVTSFEQPNPRSLLPGLTALDLDSLRRTPGANTGSPIISNNPKLYRNVPFVPGGGATIFCPSGQNAMRMYLENQTLKVPAQTQTSIDGESNNEEDTGDAIVKNSKAEKPEDPDNLSSPTSVRRKRTIRKGRSNQTTDKLPLSPAAQRRRLRKQSSIDTGNEIESNKAVNKSRKLSSATTTTTTTSEHLEDKNESRSSSSGQDSPRKDHNRRVSMYFNRKKRPSLGSVKTARSGSIDNTKDHFGARSGDPLDTTNSERERTNSTSSREAVGNKTRRSSVNSGKVPWCACWGNGCI